MLESCCHIGRTGGGTSFAASRRAYQGVTMKLESNRRSKTRVPLSPRRNHSLAAIVVFLAAAAGCARSAEDVQQEFAEVVAESNACSTVDECTYVYPGCPLDCFVAVNVSNKEEVEEKAQELIDAY